MTFAAVYTVRFLDISPYALMSNVSSTLLLKPLSLVTTLLS